MLKRGTIFFLWEMAKLNDPVELGRALDLALALPDEPASPDGEAKKELLDELLHKLLTFRSHEIEEQALIAALEALGDNYVRDHFSLKDVDRILSIYIDSDDKDDIGIAADYIEKRFSADEPLADCSHFLKHLHRLVAVYLDADQPAKALEIAVKIEKHLRADELTALLGKCHYRSLNDCLDLARQTPEPLQSIFIDFIARKHLAAGKTYRAQYLAQFVREPLGSELLADIAERHHAQHNEFGVLDCIELMPPDKRCLATEEEAARALADQDIWMAMRVIDFVGSKKRDAILKEGIAASVAEHDADNIDFAEKLAEILDELPE